MLEWLIHVHSMRPSVVGTNHTAHTIAGNIFYNDCSDELPYLERSLYSDQTTINTSEHLCAPTWLHGVTRSCHSSDSQVIYDPY